MDIKLDEHVDRSSPSPYNSSSLSLLPRLHCIATKEVCFQRDADPSSNERGPKVTRQPPCACENSFTD